MLIGIFDPMGAQSDRLRCEVCQNLILSSMNTGFLRYAVATVLTVYGIETFKLAEDAACDFTVATVLTVYGIETFLLSKPTFWLRSDALQQCLPFTVLKQDQFFYYAR